MTTRARRRYFALIALTITLTLIFHAAGAAAEKPKVAKAPRPEALRCFDGRLMDLIQQGLARSATLQELASHLERAGVIVFVSFNPGSRPAPRAAPDSCPRPDRGAICRPS